NRKIVLKSNPFYWEVSPRVSKVEFQIVVDESTAIHLFETGRLDLLTRVSALDFPRLKQKDLIHTSPLLATYYLTFNCKKFPFQNRVLRQSVANAIKKNEVTEILGAGEIPARSWIPKGLEGFIPFQSSDVHPLQTVSPRVRELLSQIKSLEGGFDS